MRRLRKNILLILILSLLLLSTIIGIIFTKEDDVLETDIVIENVIPDTFVGTIDNNIAPKEIIDAICDYMDAYYKSLYTLEKQDTSIYFGEDVAASISDKAIQLMLDARSLYDFDFTLTSAHYDIQIIDYEEYDDCYEVYFLEDDYMSFAFLNGIQSECLDIENKMTFKKIDNEYKIIDYDKQQGIYSLLYSNSPTSTKQCDDLYEYYLLQIKKYKENDDFLKSQVEGKEYISNKSYDIAYDRQKAIDYAYKYYHSRSDDWYDFSDEGGNCQNYASQCIYAGIGKMDYSGDYQWKCYINNSEYDPGINEDNEKSGRSVSWVHVSTFKDYCENNDDIGLVTDSDININYAEVGDIIQVGSTSVSHTTIVSKVVDGHILLNSNTIDMKDWPIEACIYQTKELIKILGYKD